MDPLRLQFPKYWLMIIEMNQKIEWLFKDKISLNKFIILSTVSLFICDVANILFIDQVFLQGARLDQLINNSLQMAGQIPNDLPLHLLTEMKGAFVSTFWVFLILFMINNSIFYVLYYKNKPAGIKYVKGYAFFGFALSIFNFFPPVTEKWYWIVILLISTFIYLYIFLGSRFFFPQKSS